MVAFRIIKNLAKSRLAYKFEFFGNLIFSILWILLLVVIWQAVFLFSNLESIEGFTFHDLIFYYIIIQLIRHGLDVDISYRVEQLVRYGNFVSFLLKPISFPIFCFLDDLSEKLVNIFLKILPTFLVFVLIFGLPPSTLTSFLFGIISVIFAYLLMVLIDFMLSTLIFFTKSSHGIFDVFQTGLHLIDGILFPLIFFPEKVYSILLYLPFPYLTFFPTLVFLNKADFLNVLGFQVVWILLFFPLSFFLWHLSLKRIEGAGV